MAAGGTERYSGDWVSVFRAGFRAPCHERALVLGAMDIEHRVAELPDGCHLLVPARMAAQAAQQLRLYERENPARPAATWLPSDPRAGVAGATGYAVVLVALYLAQTDYLAATDWQHAGELVAGRVRAGEWWRALTALTLHGDAAHLAGNLVFGGFFGYLAGQYLGSGVACLMILAGGTGGNLANALLQVAAHRSIGASTAVFAALGLVAAHVWMMGRHAPLGWARRWAPVVGAVALLAYIGTGDERTDVVAHLTGFVAGAGLGIIVGRLLPRPPGPAVQAVAGAAALALLAAAWGSALRGPG